MASIKALLDTIYGPTLGGRAYEGLRDRMPPGPDKGGVSAQRFSEKDVVLITYGDNLRREGQAPLQTLYDFTCSRLKALFSAIHFLPFFPYSSDDGFSVMDFYAIDPKLGTWRDVTRFGEDFDLMFDYVLNHVSCQSQWFAHYLEGRPQFAELALAVDPDADLSMVTRPRTHPLLTAFHKADGEKVHLWTTFSADQIDLNYQSIDVLLHMVDVLLFYVRKGARWLRLDAVAYLWKELGTPCIHHDKTHAMVRLLRKILDGVAPDVIIITETNVPHPENISYFGDGSDEAQLVYNFTLPPLLLYTFAVENAKVLSRWARQLTTPGEATTFFNFTASHDGIGVRPLEGILTDGEIHTLAELAVANGGKVSYKQNSDGTQSPYELNITYVDALRRDDPWDAQRFLASQAIQMTLPGVPGIYIHSLLGTRNWNEGVGLTGQARTINRRKLDDKQVEAELKDPNSFRSQIFYPYGHMLKVRRAQKAFHPNAGFDILGLGDGVFAFKRWRGDQRIWVLTNIRAANDTVSLAGQVHVRRLTDLLTSRQIDADTVALGPYQTVWLTDSD